MTRSEKLDQILYILLWVDKMELDNKPIPKKITVSFINSTNGLDLDNWEMQSLENELLEEKYIFRKNDELRITEKGKKFITRERGYKNLDKKRTQEDIIAEKTIEKFKYDKFSFWLSIVAIIISLLSLFMNQKN
jgi:hypothetical protein